jgi:PIN domain nuclease of toxin-antitoxin system
MVLLLDTHILLWALSAPGRLPLEVVNQIEIPENEVYFSAVSIWEIAIKTALRKVDFPYPPRRIAKPLAKRVLWNYPLLQSRRPKLLLFLFTITIHSIDCLLHKRF